MFKIILFVVLNIFIKWVVSQSSTVQTVSSTNETYNLTEVITNEALTTVPTNITAAIQNQNLTSTAPEYYTTSNETANATEAGIIFEYEESTSSVFPYIIMYTEVDDLINTLGFTGFILISVCMSVVFVLLSIMCTIMCCRVYKCYRNKPTYNRKPKYTGSKSDKYVYDKLIHDPEEL